MPETQGRHIGLFVGEGSLLTKFDRLLELDIPEI